MSICSVMNIPGGNHSLLNQLVHNFSFFLKVFFDVAYFKCCKILSVTKAVMPRSKTVGKVVMKNESRRNATARLRTSSKYAKVNGTIIREILPEMYRINVEKFYRGYEDVPLDYMQTHSDYPAVVTKEDIVKYFDPKHVKNQNLHVLITGPAGAGKSTVVNRLASEIYDTRIDFTEQDYIVFAINLREFNGNETMTIPHFLFHQNSAKLSAELAECLWCMTLSKPEGVLFVLHNFDTAPYDFEAECQEIDPYVKSAPVSIIVHNLLTGKLFPNCKILSSGREHRAGNFKGDVRPDIIIRVGELSEHSSKTLMRSFLGREHSMPVQNYWFHQAPSLCLLNETALYLTYSIMSVGMGEFFKLARTMPWSVLNLLLSCIYQQHFPNRLSNIKELILPIIYKMKKLAYRGIRANKYLFEGKEVAKDFDISRRDIEMTCVAYPGRHESNSKLMIIRPCGRFVFVEDHIQEFLCALYVTELPISDYKGFLQECIHKPRYFVVRRMVCSLILDPNVGETACKEKLSRMSEDICLRQELLLVSMSEEYHKVRRRDLLEFFHAVRDCGDGGAAIIPKKIDVVDFSHLQLFSLDMQAIGASLSSDIDVGYLNLSNCNITPQGLRILADKIAFTKTKITRFNLEWNPGWQSYHTGRDGLCDILKYCGVEDVSLEHSELDQHSLHALNMFLQNTKIKTLRVAHNSTLDDKGYAILGDFIMRHDVEDLYITAEDVTRERKDNLHKGLTGYVFEKGKVVLPGFHAAGDLELD